MRVRVNREWREVPEGASIRDMLMALELDDQWLAVAVGHEVVPRDLWHERRLSADDEVEVVTAMAGGDDVLEIAGHSLRSRLLVGTGKFKDMATMREALRRSGTGMVTVSVRYFGPDGGQPILPNLELERYRLLPNTAGAYTAADAIHMARLGRELTGTELIKLEVIGDQETLWPDTAATLEATRQLVAEGFKVLVYTSSDLVAALRIEDAGASAVMPLAAPIGSGQGLIDWQSIARIIGRIEVPVVVDAGIGVPSDAAMALELGADAVLVNTAIARAQDPAGMAEAMGLGVAAGRLAHLSGRIPRLGRAEASSPEAGVPRVSAS
jgi:thiazole synthase